MVCCCSRVRVGRRNRRNCQRRNKVTICHFPPGNHSNYQQISIDAAGVAAHLAHGDFLGTCASDCNVTPTLCSTPPDSCHQVGTCVASTGLCEFPTQPDRTACTGLDGLSCDSCLSGACVSVSSCPPDSLGNVEYCSPTNGGTCTPAYTTSSCPSALNPSPGTNPPAQCYATALEPTSDKCIETCTATVCGDGSLTICGNAVGCVTDADCGVQTIGDTGLPNQCITASCGQSGVCVYGNVDCGFAVNPGDPSHGCDPGFGCYTFIQATIQPTPTP